jgi:hypothetical protein
MNTSYAQLSFQNVDMYAKTIYLVRPTKVLAFSDTRCLTTPVSAVFIQSVGPVSEGVPLKTFQTPLQEIYISSDTPGRMARVCNSAPMQLSIEFPQHLGV